MKCPNCEHRFPFDSSRLFAYYCPRCDARLYVSRTYVSALALIVMATLAVLWIAIFGDLDPIAMLFLLIPLSAICTAPLFAIIGHIIPPPLVLRNYDGPITLDLARADDVPDDAPPASEPYLQSLDLSNRKEFR